MSWIFRRPARRTAGAPRPCFRPTLEALEDRMVPASVFQQTNLVSDLAGVAQITDPNLKNPWGIAVNPGGDIWVSDANNGTVTLYHGDVNGVPIGMDDPVITIPAAAASTQGSPSGQVFNSTQDFPVNGAPAFFIFASQDGTISAVSANFYTGPTTSAALEATVPGASYTGLALGNNGSGNFLYAANNNAGGTIDVFDKSFHKTSLAGNFTDPNLPAGFTPFNVANINGTLFVTYENPLNETTGGVVDRFDTNGNFLGRFAGGSNLVAPWGVVMAPAGFGTFGGDILVGNFGDGHISAYDPSGNFLGQLQGQNGQPLAIERLWGLAFGNGIAAGGANTLYFASGLHEEQDGVLGSLTPVAATTGQTQTTTTLTSVTPSPATVGQAVTLTANVLTASGTPTGTVTFFNGSTALGSAPLGAGGAASLTTSSLPAGSLTLTAMYSGDSTFAASTSAAMTVQVNAQPTTTPTATPTATPQPQTVAAFDPTTGFFYLANHNSPGAPDGGQFAFGAPGWIPLAGDWTGSGQTTIAVVDPTTETWYIRTSNAPGAPDVTPFQFGAPGWIPLAGDWTGTGHDGIGVFDPTTGTFYLRNEVGPGAPDAGKFAYGAPGWLPVVGDWSGSGHAGVGVVDPATETWYLRNTANAGAPSFTPFQYGAPGWRPVVGDWNGDGTTTVGVVDPGNTWYLRNSNSAGAPDVAPFAYGAPGWMPLAGTWGPGVAFMSPANVAVSTSPPPPASPPPASPPPASPPPASPPPASPPASPATVGPYPFQLAPGEGPGAAALANGALQVTVQAALQRLSAAGVDASLVQRLASAHFEVSALPPGVLGETIAATNTVLVSANAAGYGWFVDPTPLQNEEFAANGSALAGSAAAGHEDLLTVVLHEMGHLAGKPDVSDAGHTSDLMAETLPLGLRRTDALDKVFAAGEMA